MDEKLKKRQNKVRWTCRFHPFDWFHEVGCPHMEWSNDDLLSALITKKEYEESKLPPMTISNTNHETAFKFPKCADYIELDFEITSSVKN